MDLSRESLQRKEFCDILFDLAKRQDLLENSNERFRMYKRLEKLYYAKEPEKRFRHFYSDIFSVLTQIQQDTNLGDINILGQNLDMIRTGYKAQNKDNGDNIIDISDSIRKLYDHVNLDIARITYSEGADRRISGEEAVENLQSQIVFVQKDLEKAKMIKEDYKTTEKKVNDVKEQLENSQKEYISILGIFAAVVLAFTGGIAFSTSVLNNIAQVSVYRIILVSLVIGLVLINVLFGLFYYINSLLSKENKLTPLFVSNAIIVVLIIGIIIAWNIGWVEKRDRRIENSDPAIEKTMSDLPNDELLKENTLVDVDK